MEAGPEARERLGWKLRLVRGLYSRGMDGEEIRSFFGLIDWILRLAPALDDEFYREVEEIERSRGMRHITGIEKRGLEKGRLEGLEKGRLEGHLVASRRSLCKVLRARFGEVPTALSVSLERLSDGEGLERLLDQALACQSLADFDEALKREATGG